MTDLAFERLKLGSSMVSLKVWLYKISFSESGFPRLIGRDWYVNSLAFQPPQIGRI